MKQKNIYFAAVVLAAILLLAEVSRAQENMSEHFHPFKQLIGKTWKGIVNAKDPGQPLYDISKFEVILNGQAIRNLHSVNNGDYGGESIIYWDKDKQSLIYYYFTTAGFYTHGTFSVEDQKLVSHEYVEGNAQGITEVKGISEITADGKLSVKTQYFVNGKWTEGRNTLYEETSEPVTFK